MLAKSLKVAEKYQQMTEERLSLTRT